VQVEPITLEGRHVRLEPLAESHHAALCEVGLDPELWRWIPTPVTTPEGMAAYIRLALEWQAAGTALPFVTIERDSNTIIGSTRYMNIDKPNRRVEIGATWIARPWQRTMVNTEAKYLMLRHAFETLGCIRVELKTDSLNRRSRNAILRIGAREEGIFRNHMTTSTGRLRHSVYFSIVDSEWVQVRANLEAKLDGNSAEAGRRVDMLTDSQIGDLHRLYQNEWWTKDRTIEDVREMLDGTQVTIGFADPTSDRLIAFARVITDYTYKALILDVIVEPAARQAGLGRALMEAIIGHPALAEVRHFELYCRPDMVPYYEQWGFKNVGSALCFMRRG
jgi:RimJ/RimL family protein N-acetyltransferase/GNAT superfamily N-acetyltransferase